MSYAQRLPILWLTIRQLTAGKATRVAALFAAVPVLFALIHLFGSITADGTGYLAGLFLNLLAPTVIPLATLILATNVLGNEVADRTLPYLTLKPIGRWRIVVEKFAGAMLILALVFAVGLLITWGIVAASDDTVDAMLLPAMLAATLAGILGYGALFLLVSLVIPRALIVGVIYVLLWESTLARFIPGIRYLAVRHYEQSIFVRILDVGTVTLPDAMRLGSAIIVILALVVVTLALATLRLRTMNLN